MAAGNTLPDDDHVLRGCGRGVEGGQITGAAFEPRPQDNNKLSVDWVECRHNRSAVKTDQGSLNRLKKVLKPPQHVSKLRVGDIRQISFDQMSLDVVEAPTKKNQCHSTIIGMAGSVEDFYLQIALAEIANNGTRFSI